MSTDEFISFDEAFELLCEKAGVKGLGVQVQPGTMSLYGLILLLRFGLPRVTDISTSAFATGSRK